MSDKEGCNNYFDLLYEQDPDNPSKDFQDLGNGVHLADLASIHPELIEQGWSVDVFNLAGLGNYWVRTLKHPSELPDWVVEVGENQWINLKTLRRGASNEEVL